MRTGVHYLTLKIRRPMATARRERCYLSLSLPPSLSLSFSRPIRGFAVSRFRASDTTSGCTRTEELEEIHQNTRFDTISHVIYLAEISLSPVLFSLFLAPLFPSLTLSLSFSFSFSSSLSLSSPSAFLSLFLSFFFSFSTLNISLFFPEIGRLLAFHFFLFFYFFFLFFLFFFLTNKVWSSRRLERRYQRWRSLCRN